MKIVIINFFQTTYLITNLIYVIMQVYYKNNCNLTNYKNCITFLFMLKVHYKENLKVR